MTAEGPEQVNALSADTALASAARTLLQGRAIPPGDTHTPWEMGIPLCSLPAPTAPAVTPPRSTNPACFPVQCGHQGSAFPSWL